MIDPKLPQKNFFSDTFIILFRLVEMCRETNKWCMW